MPDHISVCAGAGAGACVPPSVFENHAGERGGSIVRSFGDNFGTILGAFLPILRRLGTILGALGTGVETPFPRFGQMLDF